MKLGFRLLALLCLAPAVMAQSGPPQLGGPVPGPLPLYPPTNWWNLDVSAAPIDTNSQSYLIYHVLTSRLHPDFGGDACSAPCTDTYGIPFITVPGNQTKVSVTFGAGYYDQCDGVPPGDTVAPNFYPIPDQAFEFAHWVEGGAPGAIDDRENSDRHILVLDRDHKHLYELWNCWYDGSQWWAGSGAFFDLNQSDRRPETWTSADAAGLAILPGLVRYDEASGNDPIRHAFRVTLDETNGFVWPASHEAGDFAGALPMGARLRLKAGKNISGYSTPIQRIFQAMKTYGLIVADNGSTGYVSGAYDPQWNNDILNPAFHALHLSDFDVIQLGWPPANLLLNDDVTALSPMTPSAATILPLDAADRYLLNVHTEDEIALPMPSRPLVFFALEAAAELELHLRKGSGGTIQIVW